MEAGPETFEVTGATLVSVFLLGFLAACGVGAVVKFCWALKPLEDDTDDSSIR